MMSSYIKPSAMIDLAGASRADELIMAILCRKRPGAPGDAKSDWWLCTESGCRFSVARLLDVKLKDGPSEDGKPPGPFLVSSESRPDKNPSANTFAIGFVPPSVAGQRRVVSHASVTGLNSTTGLKRRVSRLVTGSANDSPLEALVRFKFDQPGLPSKLLVASMFCDGCGAPDLPDSNLKRCSGCHTVRYCSRECQTAAYTAHKPSCKAIQRWGKCLV